MKTGSGVDKEPGHLVGFLSAEDGPVEDQLRRAYEDLGIAYIEHCRNRSVAAVERLSGSTSWKDVAEAIKLANEPLIKGGEHEKEWNVTEVLNCLNHMEVLVAAIEIIGQPEIGMVPTTCAPTQQHTDGDDEETADLEGGDGDRRLFVLEAYGGVNMTNNKKARNDLDALMQRQTPGEDGPRLLLAARTSALPARWRKPAEVEIKAGDRRATVLNRWSRGGDDGYTVIEVKDIEEAR